MFQRIQIQWSRTPMGGGARPGPRLTPAGGRAAGVGATPLRPAAAIEHRSPVLRAGGGEPAFGNKLPLPGVLVSADEPFEAAARRAVQTKAGLDARDWY